LLIAVTMFLATSSRERMPRAAAMCLLRVLSRSTLDARGIAAATEPVVVSPPPPKMMTPRDEIRL
jgi:hypothetical protein